MSYAVARGFWKTLRNRMVLKLLAKASQPDCVRISSLGALTALMVLSLVEDGPGKVSSTKRYV